MEPITLATITAAVTTLGIECAKGAAKAAGQSLWGKVKSLLGWSDDPELSQLAETTARALMGNPSAAQQIVKLLQASEESDASASALVGSIDAEKVVVANRIDVEGDFNM